MDSPDKSDLTKGKDDVIAVGVVIEALPNTLFRVEITSEQVIMAYLSGKMRLHRIRVLVGDRVEIWLDPYGGKGRVIRRL